MLDRLTPVFVILLVVVVAVDYTLLMLRFVHMLQLNSYRTGRYFKWANENTLKLFAEPWWLNLAVYFILIALYYIRFGLPIAILVYILHAYINRPKKTKKPLVYTARVKRLLITQGLLALLLCGGYVGLYFAADTRLDAVLVLLIAFTPVLTPICNLINTPMENAISRWYVNDARRILRESPHLITIGITGSYGKTSAKNFLHALLSVKYNVLMTPESYNTTMGVVRTVRERLLPSHQVFIAEMGAKNVGDIQEICNIVHPRYGLLTSIGEQHLETFKTIDNIIRTKFELADCIPSNGFAFLNADNEYIRSHAVNVPVITYGVQKNSDAQYTAADIKLDGSGCSFTVTTPSGESRRFSTKLLGSHNVQNILGCIAIAHTLGIALDDLVLPVRKLQPVPHRLQLLPNGYIDDAYNSNPAGFRAALDVLREFEGQRVLVTPGMVELGTRQEALNQEMGFYAASCCDYAVLVGEKQAPPLKAGLLSAGFPDEKLYVATDLQDALRYVQSLPADGQRTVLLENDLPDNF